MRRGLIHDLRTATQATLNLTRLFVSFLTVASIELSHGYGGDLNLLGCRDYRPHLVFFNHQGFITVYSVEYYRSHFRHHHRNCPKHRSCHDGPSAFRSVRLLRLPLHIPHISQALRPSDRRDVARQIILSRYRKR